ncbi:MAG TPA: hypothetical protein VF236_08545 [Gaiellaceae bacterium]
MATEEEARIARTESVFRHVNEQIAEVAEQLDGDEAAFVCECAEVDCRQRVEAPLEAYEDVRAEPTTFLVAEGHEVPAYEHVRRRRRGYLIVEKMTRGLRKEARRTDPRAEPAS